MSHDSTIVDWPAELPAPLLGRRHQHIPRGLGTQMDSKRIRMRREFTESIELVLAEWNFTLDQFETFKLFFENTLQNGSLPFEIRVLASTGSDPDVLEDSDMTVAFWNGLYSFTRSDNLYSVSATLEVTVAPIQLFVGEACAVIIDGSEGAIGGGDTFDCYAESELVESVPVAGTGFSGPWQIGDSPFATPQGDNFETYPEEDPVTVTNALDDGTGMAGFWLHGDGI